MCPRHGLVGTQKGSGVYIQGDFRSRRVMPFHSPGRGIVNISVPANFELLHLRRSGWDLQRYQPAIHSKGRGQIENRNGLNLLQQKSVMQEVFGSGRVVDVCLVTHSKLYLCSPVRQALPLDIGDHVCDAGSVAVNSGDLVCYSAQELIHGFNFNTMMRVQCQAAILYDRSIDHLLDDSLF